MKYKILHAPYNIVDIPRKIAKEFKKFGYTCDVMTFYADHRQYDAPDYILLKGSDNNQKNKNFNLFKIISFFLFSIIKYNIFQFHQRATLLPRNLDILFIRLLRKNFFIYHHGSDVIGNDNYLKHVPHSKWAKAIFISTPDLYDFVPKSAILIPQAISIDFLKKYKLSNKVFRDRATEKIVITHAVHSEMAMNHKGSYIIKEVIKGLKAKGVNIDFKLFIGIKHEEVIKEIADADIHIDQIIYGWHGTISAEAMALGTPVLCYIREDLEKYAKELPIFRSSKSQLSSRLLILINNFTLRKKLSHEGKKYVEREHDAPVIAKKILEHYE